ncbi:MAG: hypothetical protein PHG06_00695 [Parabacteroides sp.]|jgi:hypothetical protein|nr:hypothetical protein [Parabacteroides sp.]
MSQTPLTTSRKFDPTYYGLQKNQQEFAVLLCIPLVLLFLIGMYVLGPDITVKLCEGLFIIEALIFIKVARSAADLYHFECTIRFLKSIKKGDDFIEKHGKFGVEKARGFTHLKKIHEGKYVEFYYTKERPHNWSTFIKIDSISPENLVQFADSIEKLFIGFPDKTVIKTILQLRSDNTDYAEPIRAELKRDRIPQVVRESMFELQGLCEEAEQKSYICHMQILLDYTQSFEKAKKTLDIITNNISECLGMLKVGNEILKTDDEILDMYYSMITYGVHIEGV